MAVPASIDDPRRTPIVIAIAVGLHAVVALAMPTNVSRIIEAISSPDSLIEFETMTPLPEPEVAPLEPPRPVERERPVEDAPETVATPEPTPVTPTEAAVTEVAASAPTEVMVGATTTSGMAVSEGQAGGSQVHLGPPSNGTDPVAEPAVVDTRALARTYRTSIRSAIGSLPRLRGVNEPIEANVLIGMHIGADGRVTDVRIVRSSGHDVIDQHVLDFYRNVRRVPAPPPELQLDRQELTIRVEAS